MRSIQILATLIVTILPNFESAGLSEITFNVVGPGQHSSINFKDYFRFKTEDGASLWVKCDSKDLLMIRSEAENRSATPYTPIATEVEKAFVILDGCEEGKWDAI